MKKILHICNNYVSSKVHERLISQISLLDFTFQDILIPVRRQSDVGINNFKSINVSFLYFKYPGGFLKFFPFVKLISVFILSLRNWRNKKSVEVCNPHLVILAHTLWSDGVIAFLYNLLFGYRYYLVVRNTDINWFLPKLPHYRWLIWLVLKRASGLIFVTPIYKKKFAERYPQLFLAAKSVSVIPNGIDNYWLKGFKEDKVSRRIVVLFVGRFDKNKNLGNLVKAVDECRKDLPELQLWLAGGSEKEFLNLVGISLIPNWIRCCGKIESKSQLKKLYQTAAVLAVPSFHETFGLVYIEALSQGCPFVYSENEGVDGFFEDDDFCEAVNPYSSKSIGRGILDLMHRYPNGVPLERRSVVKNYNWEQIATAYTQRIFG